MKILVLDADQGHNKRVSQALGGDAKTEIFYFDQLEPFVEVLNGLPLAEKKKAELEKMLADSNTLITKATENLNQLEKTKLEKSQAAEALVKGSSGSPNQADAITQAKKITEEVKIIESTIAKEKEVKNKLEEVTAKKSQELDLVNKSVLKAEAKKCSIVLIDRSYMGNNPLVWVAEFRNKIQLTENKEVPLVVLGYNSELEYIHSVVVPGVSDYFIKPVDLLLLKHNTAKLSGKTMDADDKVYEIQTKALVKVLQVAKVSKLSEFEMTAHVRSPFNPKELVELFADVFNMKKGERILAMCKSCEPDPNEKGFFTVLLSFVGLSPHIMNEIRKWLKTQYVNQKEKDS